MEKSRIEMLSDGVFAIVITLLVLDIKLPLLPEISNDTVLKNGLIKILPNIIAYILSFCIIGIFWTAHHSIFHFIKAVNKKLLWLNVFYLMVVAFIPFPTSILAEHHDKQTAIILYCFTLGLGGLFHFIVLNYLKKHKELSAPTFTEQIKNQILFPSLFGPISYALAILFSYVSIIISFGVILIVPTYYIFVSDTSRPTKKGSS